MQKLNRFLRSWAGYFRYGNSAWEFSKLRVYAALRFLLWWTNRRHWRRPNVWRRRMHGVADRLGLLTPAGWVVASRPNRPWPEQPNASR